MNEDENTIKNVKVEAEKIQVCFLERKWNVIPRKYDAYRGKNAILCGSR